MADKRQAGDAMAFASEMCCGLRVCDKGIAERCALNRLAIGLRIGASARQNGCTKVVITARWIANVCLRGVKKWPAWVLPAGHGLNVFKDFASLGAKKSTKQSIKQAVKPYEQLA